MAQKGTYTALQRLTPIKEDFGGIAEDIADDFVAQKERDRAAAAADLALKQKKKAAAKKLQEETAKDLADLAKYSNFSATPVKGVKGLDTVFYSSYQKKVSALQKEAKTATGSRRIDIKAELEAIKGLGVKYNADAGGLSTVVEDMAKGFTDGTYDPVLSAKYSKALNEAISSGNVKGAWTDEEGNIKWGDGITMKDFGSGNIQVEIRDSKGELVSSGMLGEMAGRLKSGLKKFVNTDKALVDFGKDFAGDEVQKILSRGSSIETLRKVDLKRSRKSLEELFDNQYGSTDKNGKPINDVARKWISIGIGSDIDKDGDVDIDDMKKSFVDSRMARLEKDAISNLKKSPQWAGMQKEKKFRDRLANIKLLISGEEEQVEKLKGEKWGDAGRIVNINRTGNVLTVQTETGSGKNRRSTTTDYDLNDPETFENMIYLANDSYSQGKAELTVNFDEMNKFRAKGRLLQEVPKLIEESVVTATPEEVLKDFSESVKELKGSGWGAEDKLDKALDPVKGFFNVKGYGVEVDTRVTKWGNDYLRIKDPDGKEVETIKVSADRTKFIEEVKELVRKYVGVEDKPKEEAETDIKKEKITPSKGFLDGLK